MLIDRNAPAVGQVMRELHWFIGNPVRMRRKKNRGQFDVNWRAH